MGNGSAGLVERPWGDVRSAFSNARHLLSAAKPISIPAQRLFFALLLVIAPAAANAAPYSIEGLGTAPGANFCVGTAMNESGQVAGHCFYGGSFRAFFYASGSMTVLGLPAGFRSSTAYGISGAGHVVGTLEAPDSQVQAFFWDGATVYGLGQQLKQAIAINDVGTVGGIGGEAGPFLFPGGALNILAPSGTATVYGLNNLGHATGLTTGGSDTHAYFFNGTTVLDLGTLGGPMSQGLSINEQGRVVGLAQTAAGLLHAFLWNGVMLDLGTLGGSFSMAQQVNDLGVVVGNSTTTNGEGRAFIWDGVLGMRDLNYLIPAGSGWVLEGAMGIANDGSIMGVGQHNGRTETFLLKPAIAMPPIVTSVTAIPNLIPVGQATFASGTSTDADSTGPFVASWTWGDGTNSAGVVSSSGGAATAVGQHTYNTPGVYTVGLAITDERGTTGQGSYKYVVVYDPSAGFVTGGGWFTSPQGAYGPDPLLTGKASFGFVSRYQKGSLLPSGDTEFNFKVANLNFRSTGYDWLVVSGTKAMYKGVGTINGVAGYRFLLSAIDGNLSGGGGVDKLRIKIWSDGNGLVYDNMASTGDEADPLQGIEGGSIVIHK